MSSFIIGSALALGITVLLFASRITSVYRDGMDPEQSFGLYLRLALEAGLVALAIVLIFFAATVATADGWAFVSAYLTVRAFALLVEWCRK